LKNRNFELIRYEGKQDALSTTIDLSKHGNWNGMPAQRKMVFEVWRNIRPAKVLINGKEVSQLRSSKSVTSTYQYKDGWLKISFLWKGEPVKIEIVEPRIK